MATLYVNDRSPAVDLGRITSEITATTWLLRGSSSQNHFQ